MLPFGDPPDAAASDSFRTWFYAAMAFGSVGMAMTAPITPLYAKELGASDAMAGVVVASLMVPLLVVDLFGSRIVNRVDPRTALWRGYAVFGVGSLLSAFAPDVETMTAARLLQGFAAAFPVGAGFHTALRLATPGRQAREIAWFNACMFAGLAVGPLLVAAIGRIGDDLTGMRWSFAACAGVNVLAAVLARRSLPPMPSGERPRLGLPPRALVAGRRMRLALVVTGAAFALRGIVGMTLLPLLGDAVGIDSIGVSSAIVLMSTLEVVGIFTSGRLADRFGRRPLVCWTAAAGVLLTIWAATSPGGIGYFALCGVVGFVLAGLRVGPTAMLADIADSSESAAIGWRVASDVGMVGLSALTAAALQFGGLGPTFGIAAALTAMVGVLAYVSGETQASPRDEPAVLEADGGGYVALSLENVRMP